MPPTRRIPARHGEDALPTTKAIKITTEDGQSYVFQLGDEVSIPSDPDDQLKAMQHASARYAFWGYQTERALGRVRTLEYELTKSEGLASIGFRALFDSREESYTEDVIRSRVSQDEEVDKLRMSLNEAREQYGVLRATRDAVEHRLFALRQLIQSTTGHHGHSH